MSSVKRAKHAVYDIKYHFIWVPKYRKLILQGPVADSLKGIFQGIAARYEFEIDTLEVMPDHIHLFLLTPPKHSPSEAVQIFKSVSARELFRSHPELREELWGGELWGDGYFVRLVGDEVTAEVIRRYIKLQHEDQLRLDL
jgi:putative transposase